MIRPIGDRFVYKGYTLEVVSQVLCEGCFFYDGDDCLMDDDGFTVCGCCSSIFRNFSCGVIFKVVGMNGDLAIGHETLVYNKKIRVERANVDNDGIDLCDGCFFIDDECGCIIKELKLGRCSLCRYDNTGVIFRLVEEGGEG